MYNKINADCKVGKITNTETIIGRKALAKRNGEDWKYPSDKKFQQLNKIYWPHRGLCKQDIKT